MPPGTGQLTILLIIITLAESDMLGELLEAPAAAALRDKAFKLPQGGHIHPRRVQGEGPGRYKLSRSDDAVDSGRGRSEAQPNGAPPLAA